MKDFLTVFSYTFREHIRKKSFIISTVILIGLAVLIMLLPSIITSLQQSEKPQGTPSDNKDSRGVLYVLDKENILQESFEEIQNVCPGYDVKAANPKEAESLIESTNNEEDVFFLEVYMQDQLPAANYYFKQYASGPDPDSLSDAIKKRYDDILLKSSGVSEEIITKLRTPIHINLHETGSGFFKGQITNIFISILLFMSVYYYGYWIAQSVASEKTSRVMEILITSIKPTSIIAGKTAAMGLLGLLQLATLLFSSGLTYRLAFPKDFTVYGQQLNLSSFTPLALVMILVYFILGYGMYAMLNAVAGASVSRAEDINTAIMPISLIGVLSFYFAYTTALIPGAGKISSIASIVPFSAPFSMPGRILNGDVQAGELLLSVAVLLITILLLARISVRLYSSAVLHYGKRLKIHELFKLAKK